MKRMCSEPGTHTPVCQNTAAFMYTVNYEESAIFEIEPHTKSPENTFLL